MNNMCQDKRKIEVFLNIEDDVKFAEIDYPGMVYGDNARISFFGKNKRLISCRLATESELISLQAKL